MHLIIKVILFARYGSHVRCSQRQYSSSYEWKSFARQRVLHAKTLTISQVQHNQRHLCRALEMTHCKQTICSLSLSLTLPLSRSLAFCVLLFKSSLVEFTVLSVSWLAGANRGQLLAVRVSPPRGHCCVSWNQPVAALSHNDNLWFIQLWVLFILFFNGVILFCLRKSFVIYDVV